MSVPITKIISLYVYERYNEGITFRRIAEELREQNIKVTYQTVFNALQYLEENKSILSLKTIEQVQTERVLEAMKKILSSNINNEEKITLVNRLFLVCIAKQMIMVSKKTTELFDLYLELIAFARLHFELKKDTVSIQFMKSIMSYLNIRLNFDLLRRKKRKKDFEKELSKHFLKVTQALLFTVLFKKDMGLESLFSNYSKKLELLKKIDFSESEREELILVQKMFFELFKLA